MRPCRHAAIAAIGLALPAAIPAAAQEMPSQVATRTEKADYLPAVALCREAVELIGTDPRTAADKLTEVIDNAKVKKVECLLRIELRPSEYTPPYAFTPYRYRGQAWVALAQRDAANAARHLARAVEDFQKSLAAGVTASGDLLKAAQASLEEAKAAAAKPPLTTGPAPPPAEDAVLKFKPGWQRLVDQGRYRSALAAVAQATALPEADRKRFEADTRRLCADAVIDALGKYRRSLGGIEKMADVTAMTAAEFDRAFALPAPDELVDPPPACAWARSLTAAFQEIRSGKSAPAALLPVAAGAVPLAEKGDPQWFQAVEPLAFKELQTAIQKEVEGARDAPQAARDAARKRAEALLGAWKPFVGGLSPAFLAAQPDVARHDKDLADAMAGFPVELKALDSVDLGACFVAPNPDQSLQEVRKALEAMDPTTGPPLAVESRRLLYTRLAIVGALQALLAGRTEDEAARSLQPYRSKLQAAGGPLDAKAYGPRVERVLQLLLAQGG